MNASWSLNYRVRRGYEGDEKEVLGIFFSALREHGLEVLAKRKDAEIERFGFGSGNDPTQDHFVAVTGGRVCGFLVLCQTAQEGCGELSKVFVARSHRGRGVGTMLIRHCVQRATERGCRELVLETDTAFSGARRYYERHGWTLMPYLPEETTRIYTMRLYGRCRVEAAPLTARTG